MKFMNMKKIIILFIMFAMFLALGTFFHIDKIQANTYLDNDPWYGTDLDFTEINPSFITYESKYVPFETIINNPLLADEAKVYVIESAYDLYMFSTLNNGVDYDIYRRLSYVLGNDIDYYDVVITDSSKTFEPVGFRYPFLGTFDGQGFEITNLYLDTIYDSLTYEEKYLGLIYFSMFSHVGSSGVIKNLGLINPLIIQPIEWGAMRYVSPLIGLNEGHIHHVYYIDFRDHQAGLHAEGAFQISGLVSNNQGTVEEAFVASPHIKSLAVLENESDAAVVGENSGYLYHVYYDQELLQDQQTSRTYGIGLNTNDFQNDLLFDQAWYFNYDYEGLTDNLDLKQQYHLDQTYPNLQGLKVNNQVLEINDAIDLVYMNELLSKSNLFRSTTYQVVHDIDMNQVSYNAYRQASLGFNGVLTSSLQDETSRLYERDPLQGGNISYHTIIGLEITNASYVGNQAIYGLFSVLFGCVEHLNFIDTKVVTSDIDETYERDYLSVGIIAGQTNLGVIYDVHISGEIHLESTTEAIGNISLGMFVGQGSGRLESISSEGSIYLNEQTFQTKLDESSIGGIIGKADETYIIESIDNTYKEGLSYINPFEGTTFIGGMIGSGSVEQLDHLISKGHINLTHAFHQNILYVGGVFGKISLLESNISSLYHTGVIDVLVNQSLTIRMNGIGHVISNDVSHMLTSITNHGELNLISDPFLSLTELNLMDIRGSFGLTVDGSATIYGLYQTKDQLIDLSLIDSFSGVLTHISDEVLHATKLYQKGNFIFQSSNDLTQDHIQISGLLLGSHYHLDHIRQEGYIDINVYHQSQRFDQGILEVSGIFETLSDGYQARNIYQGGHISIEKDVLLEVNYDVKVSAIGIRHLNTSFFADKHIDEMSIEITDQIGSIDTFLNKGNVYVSGHFDGNVTATGIMLYNYGLITRVINLGDVEIFNDVLTLDDKVQASGIVHQMIGSYAQIKDSANHGSIKAVSNTSLGYAHASGLVLRNDQLEDGADVSNGNLHKHQKILFSINYGDIYAFNNSDESSYTVSNETRAKASGFLALGVLSTINNANFGNVFSNHLASAMIGFLYLNKFGTLGYDEVFISNQMNYGRVREITGYNSVDQLFNIDMNQAPQNVSYHAYGAIVGKIHTGTSSWSFAGDVEYPLDRIYFGYLLNFDEKIDMFDRAPTLSSTWSDVYGGDTEAANDVILEMQKYMATTNPDDQSAPPFNEFYAGGFIGQYLGKQISYYDLTDTETGMFYEDFAFRNQRPAYKGTDQYILDYIQYIPREKINDYMVDRLEANTINEYPGMYALSSSKGIGNGIFIPDNFELEGLHEYHQASPDGDLTYLGDPHIPESISHDLYTSMRQIKVDFATTIYDLEIKQINGNGEIIEQGVTLKNPVIDQERALITYYLPSNATILGDQTPTIMNVNSYVEVSPHMTGARKVLDLIGSGDPTYTWLGTHKKVDNQMVEIGPYKETGVYNLTSNLVFTDSTSRSNPLYNYSGEIYDTIGSTNHIFTHNPHILEVIWIWNYWYTDGYQVTPSAVQNPGYAPYEAYMQSGYPTLYKYVGPSTEAITYVASDNISGVYVYEPSDVRFIANTQEGTYQISESASFEYLGTSLLEPISIPRSYGVYDLMSYEGQYIDSVEDHYGMIRVYSSAYNSTDPSTYKDYDIRVIRTADESITNVLSLSVNGMDALNPSDSTQELTSLLNLNGTNENILEVSYETYNIADLYDIIQHVEVYNFDNQVKIHSSYYRLDQGSVSTASTFDNLNGSWGHGSFSISFTPLEHFPSGNYVLKTTLLSGSVYNVHFTKDVSSEKSVLNMVYQGESMTPTDSIYTSSIPYGIFYDASDAHTNMVNFTNLSSFKDVSYDMINESIPSYLESMTISYFASIRSISLDITKLIDNRYQYDIIYTIEAEDQSTSVFTHRLIETSIASTPTDLYKNGGQTESLQSVDVKYEEAPNIRMVYDLDQFYISHIDLLDVTHTFTPLNMAEIAALNQDYFISKIEDVGYEINLNKNTPKGSYEFQMLYANEITLWGETLTWAFSFDLLYINKLRNNESKVEDILFVSDTIFSGFNTIVDYTYIDTVSYEGYMNDPSTRNINVLPTTGVVYNDYDDYQIYYVIGQVQKTNLSSYEPVFYISDYARIRRVIDQTHIHYDYQSEDLTADFAPMGDTFNYVQYRVYAEDYDQNHMNYTDYYVAVQDVTNNIRFEVTIDNQTGDLIEDIYFSIDICQSETECDDTTTLYQMGAFALYNDLSDSYELNLFQTTMHGTYMIYVDLSIGYTYQIILEESQIDGTSFYLEDSILPRKYHITIVITTTLDQNEWGYTYENTPLS
ncbi:hypothetical protein BK011_03135 [Tenericutes bacterium MZ-XQ]|nr:hypothetical protein BK011_03135 [Tenericutes bacterium MZ-XQ]